MPLSVQCDLINAHWKLQENLQKKSENKKEWKILQKSSQNA